MEIISQTKQKARKEHTCNWCNGKIKVGESYSRSFCKDDDVYIWKNHIYCSEILTKLKAFDEGAVSNDDFVEQIKEEYQRIMSKNYSTIYETKDFSTPTFKEQLYFICCFYKIDIT